MRLSRGMHITGIALLTFFGYACLQMTDTFLGAVALWVVWVAPTVWLAWRFIKRGMDGSGD